MTRLFLHRVVEVEVEVEAEVEARIVALSLVGIPVRTSRLVGSLEGAGQI